MVRVILRVLVSFRLVSDRQLTLSQILDRDLHPSLPLQKLIIMAERTGLEAPKNPRK